VPHDQRYHACSVCHLTPLPETGTCGLCDLHERLGQKLPATSHVAFIYGDDGESLLDPGHAAAFNLGPPFDVTVALLKEEETGRFLGRLGASSASAALYRLNDVDLVPPDAPPNAALGFRFLANEAPLDDQGRALDFDGIADRSQGAQLLGVLKADVDRLGFIFSAGIRPTLSRASTLSGALELYFGGRLDGLCREVAEEGFYTVYAGGDDLFILGPWDRVVALAGGLYDDFRRYACYNENVTLSAGVLLVKPHFPIHRFAHLVGEKLDGAKGAGRDKIAAFGETVDWTGGTDVGYDELLALGRRMAAAVDAQKLHKGFVYFLKRLHDGHFDEEAGWRAEDPMWVPKFHYAVARQVSEEAIHELDLLSQVPRMMEHIQVPVSYVSLKTRKE
jgi:CRISPR-associated protein Csm1